MSDNFPDGWSKTIKELIAENRLISAEEMRWAREYERSLLRSKVKFPRNGEIYEATSDVEVRYMIHWRAPFSDGGTCILNKGRKVRVMVDAGEDEPLVVTAVPLEYQAFEQECIPQAVRKAFRYEGFSLSIYTTELNRSFKLV